MTGLRAEYRGIPGTMDANKHKYKRMKDCSLLQNNHICSGAHSPAHRGLFPLGVKGLGRESDQFYLVSKLNTSRPISPLPHKSKCHAQGRMLWL
jgi:hypothetical protein